MALGGGDPETPNSRARVMKVGLREAVMLSLNHNVDLEVARYQPWIEDQNILSTFGAWDHTAYASVSGGESISAGFSSLSGASRVDDDSAAFTIGVRKTLPFGPRYDLSFSSERYHTNNSFVLIDPRWNQTMRASVTVPLLRGAWTETNTATLLVARLRRDGAVDTFERQLAEQVFRVIEAYGELVYALENRRLKAQSLEVAERLLDDNRRRFERGVVARIEVTQADAGVAAQLEGILTAEASALNAEDLLKQLIDPSLLRGETTVIPGDAPRVPVGKVDADALRERAVEAALARRPELRRIRHDLAAQKAASSQAENDLLPVLDITGRASMRGTDGTFSSAGSQARSGDFRDLSVGIIFEIPLERSTARAAWRRAELQLRRLRLQQRALEDQVLVEVRAAVRSIRTDERRIAATRRARELAEEQLTGEMTRLRQGLSTTFRVLDLQEDLAGTRANELRALIDHGISRHRLDLATGELLDRHQVVLRENMQPRITP